MALEKTGVSINFAKGIEQGVDPWQIPIGNFESLVNSVFDKVGRLQKRFGFPLVTALPDSTSRYATTFQNALTTMGTDLKSFSQGQGAWNTKGNIQPLSLSTLPLVRNNLNQSQVDAAIAPNGLVCTVYTDDIVAGSTTAQAYRYTISDSVTGQTVIQPTQITSTFGTVTYSPRVFSLGNYFITSFATVGTAGAWRLQYIPISSVNPRVVGSVTDVSTDFAISSYSGSLIINSFDGAVANNSLYFSYNRAANAGIKARFLTSSLALSSEAAIGSSSGNAISVCADTTQATPVVWTSYGVVGSGSVRTVATNQALTTLFSSQISVASNAAAFDTSTAGWVQHTAAAKSGVMSLYVQYSNVYPYDGQVGRSDFLSRVLVTQTGSVDNNIIVVRSVGLGSKAFIIGSQDYFLSNYRSNLSASADQAFQTTYFLMNSSGGVIAKLAYGNAGGYGSSRPLPQGTVSGPSVSIPYLYREEIQAVNKDTNVAAGTQTLGIFSQLGINLAKFTLGTDGLTSVESGQNLNFNGGYVYGYDGTQVTENGFHLYPDNVVCSASVAGAPGSMAPQQYYYQATYEWSDNQGNLFRSAPSIPVTATLASGSARMIVYVPTLRLTSKTQNPVKIVLYRWSAAQQTYYQTTSITTPVINSTSVDYVTVVDLNSDATILGNNLIYTTGGVLENIAMPAMDAITQFDSRLWGILSENKNTLGYTKQVIQATPVEFSDLLTLYVDPNIGAQGSTGDITSIFPMDDKLIIFKKNAIYFINGRGPDNTGASNQYSEPTFITGVVGCDNQNSIVMIPQGLMFQSDKGIWLLGRNLATDYIGKEVDDFNDDEVVSTVTVPGTNQVRFNLQSGSVLMYDYYAGQWGEFRGISGISSTLYQNRHTYINSLGQVFQEAPNTYLDGSNAVVMSFRTGWFSFAGLQGYQRAYAAYFLGEYLSPHIYRVGIAYDYDSNLWQNATVVPNNYSGPWGSGTSWGSIITWGGNSSTEPWQINFERQQCQSFQISFQEYFDSSKGEDAGAGLTLSGMNIKVGLKRGWAQNIPAKNRTS